MKFRELAIYLEKLEKTSSRLEITEILADLYKKAKADEVDKITYLLLGRLAPSYEGVVFNIAERMLLQVISNAYQVEVEKVRFLYKKKGDLGDVAEELAKNKGQRTKDKGKKLVSYVYESLLEIAQDEGEKSQERKIDTN